jgi:nicotinamide riboside kinase
MPKSKALVLNLYGGPGSGKSTTMAGVFSELKLIGINCEMAQEFAKEKVWEGSFGVLDNQIYVFGKQFHSVERVRGKVDIVVTDSPVLLSLVYGKTTLPEFKKLVVAVDKQFWSLNFFLERHKKYNPAGRMQNEEEAREKDLEIKSMLDSHNINYEVIDGGREAIGIIVKKAMDELTNRK